MNLRKTVLFVALANLAYFLVEFHFGRIFDSIALIGDSIDFLEDASVNLLIFVAIGWSLSKRRRVSYLLALLLLIPGVTFLWNAVSQLASGEVPNGAGMGWVGIGALIVNVSCALLIARHKAEEGGLVMAAYFSARNDAIANVLIIIAGLITLVSPSIWPDLVIGLIIFALNSTAAREIIQGARGESNDHRA